MKRISIYILALGLLSSCKDGGNAPVQAGVDDRLHAHSRVEAAARTLVGEIRSIDAGAGTLTVDIGEGRAASRPRNRTRRTFSATPNQLTLVRVGDVVEFRSVPARPHPRLLSIVAHGHRPPRPPARRPEAE